MLLAPLHYRFSEIKFKLPHNKANLKIEFHLNTKIARALYFYQFRGFKRN